MKNTLFWSTAFLSLLQGVWAGVPGIPGATNAVPGMATNTPPTMVPGAIPGGVGTIPAVPGMAPGGVPGIAPTNAVPGGVPGMVPGTIPGGATTNMVPGTIPGAPSINPGTGIPVPGGNTTVSTNLPQAQIQEIVTDEAIFEAMRIFTQNARIIRENAELGIIQEQHNLAVLYGLGLGVPLDHQKAFQWYKTAADTGLPESQFNVAIAFQNGMGTKKDLVNAYKYFTLAAAQGFMMKTNPEELPKAYAAEHRDYLAQFLTRSQIESGQRMARGFMINLERRRYFSRRKDFETFKSNLILKGLDPNDPTNYTEYKVYLFQRGLNPDDKVYYFGPMKEGAKYRLIPDPLPPPIPGS
jgi:hypothetical protein